MNTLAARVLPGTKSQHELFLHLNERWKIVRNNLGLLKLAKKLSAPKSPLLFDKLQVLILTPDVLNPFQKEVPCASVLLLLINYHSLVA